MSFAQEIKDFVAGFTQTYKMVSEKQSRDVYNNYLKSKYGDEDLSKYDPRLKTSVPGLSNPFSGGLLSGWFSSGEKSDQGELTGADRGRAILEAKMKRAAEQGDPEAYAKLNEQRLLFNKFATSGGPGFEDVQPAKGKDLSGAAPVVPPPDEEQPQTNSFPFFSRGGVVQSFALGGSVEDPYGETGEEKDPTELYAAAEPAVAAGLRAINSRLQMPAVDDGTPNPNVEKFAKAEGRMSEDEVRAIDSKIDPNGELTPGQRSAARLASVYQYFGEKDPELGAEAAARLLLREKFASQTRGAMALNALKQDDLESGVKLIADAYNENLPDGNTIHAKIDPVDKGVLFKQINALGQEITGGKVDKSQLIQLASNTADGSAFTERLQRIANMADEARKRGKGGSGGGTSAGRAAAGLDVSAFNEAKAKYLELAADENADPKAVAQAEIAMQTEYQKVAGQVKLKKNASDSTAYWTLNQAGIKLPGAPGAGGSGGGSSVEERKAAAQAAENKEFRRDAQGALDTALQGYVDATMNPQYRPREAPTELVGEAPAGMGAKVLPDSLNTPTNLEEGRRALANNFAMEFGATPGTQARNIRARDEVELAKEDYDALEATIAGQKNERDLKLGGQQNEVEEKIVGIFDNMEKGPFARIAVDGPNGEKIPDPAKVKPADIDQFKDWAFQIAIRNKMTSQKAVGVVMAMTSLRADDPSAKPFEVVKDKRGRGMIRLSDGTATFALDGDTYKQILAWRKAAAEEAMRKAGDAARKTQNSAETGAKFGDFMGAVGTAVTPTIAPSTTRGRGAVPAPSVPLGVRGRGAQPALPIFPQ